MKTKSELRLWAKDIRKNLDIKDISTKIVNNIRGMSVYQNSDNVMIFYPLKKEINLMSLLEDGKNFYIPRVNGDNLDVCPYRYGDKLNVSSYGISEPLTEPVGIESVELIIAPALSVDNNFYRLGYGGGFYDRFFEKMPKNITKAVVIPEELLIDNLPVDENDIPCDCVITQKKASF